MMRILLQSLTRPFNDKSLTRDAEDLAYLRRTLPLSGATPKASDTSHGADFIRKHAIYRAAFQAILKQPAHLDPVLYHNYRQSLNGSSVFKSDVIAQTRAEIALARSDATVRDLLRQTLEAGQVRALSRHLKDLSVPLKCGMN